MNVESLAIVSDSPSAAVVSSDVAVTVAFSTSGTLIVTFSTGVVEFLLITTVFSGVNVNLTSVFVF